MADPCIAPGDNSHTCRGLSPYRGGLGGHSKLAPLLSRALYPKRQRKSSMRFKTCFYRVAELQFLPKHLRCFVRKRENTSTNYRTSYLVTSTCTSYPFTHHHPTSTTTSGGVNGAKNPSGPDCSFSHGWPIPVSPQEITPTLVVGYLPSVADWGYQGLSLRILPAFLTGPIGAAFRFFSSP